MVKNSFNPDFALKSIRLKNIFSFQDETFNDLNQCAILIGKNNSGKYFLPYFSLMYSRAESTASVLRLVESVRM